MELAKEKNYQELVNLMLLGKKRERKVSCSWMQAPKSSLQRVSMLTSHRQTKNIKKLSIIDIIEVNESDSIDILFGKIENLQILSNSGKDGKKSRPLIIFRDFLKLITKSAFDTQGTSDQDVNVEIKWPKLFRKRMFDTNSILTQKRIDNLMSVIKSFLKFESDSSTYWVIAESLLNYLQIHKYDPENAILGLSCKSSIIGEFQKKILIFNECEKVFGDNLWTFGESKMKSIENQNQSKLKFDLKIKKAYIIYKIDEILSSDLNNDEKVNQVKYFTKYASLIDIFQSYWSESIVYGDILIVADNNKKKDIFTELPKISSPSYVNEDISFKFVRYAGLYDSEKRLLSVFDNHEESSMKQIPIQKCIPLPSSWYTNFGSVDSLDRLIENPAIILLSRFGLYLKESFDKLLLSNQIDMELLENIISLKIEVSEVQNIKVTRQKIQALIIEFPNEFIVTMEQTKKEIYKKFTQSETILSEMFIPTKKANINDLDSIDIKNLISKRFTTLLNYCTQVLKYLDSQKQLVVNGTKKQEITSWWLKEIKTKVKEFLEGIDYNFSAVGYDYIERPPDDLNEVRKNLVKIEKILSYHTNNDIYNVNNLLDEMKSLIYPKIDLFIKNAQTTICDKLSIWIENFSVDYCLSLIKDEDSDLIDLLKDIEYLEKIKAYEINSPTEKDLNVVPISGLVMGNFYRLENELKTVLEVWDPAWDVKKPKRKVERTSFAENRVTMMMVSRSETLREDTLSQFLTPQELEMLHNIPDASQELLLQLANKE